MRSLSLIAITTVLFSAVDAQSETNKQVQISSKSIPVSAKLKVDFPDDDTATEELKRKKMFALKEKASELVKKKCHAQGGRIERSRNFSDSKRGIVLAPSKYNVMEWGERSSLPKSKIVLYVNYVFTCWVGIEKSKHSLKIKDPKSKRTVLIELDSGTDMNSGNGGQSVR